jgi:membrane protein implicated in regulation of membrane protease activity
MPSRRTIGIAVFLLLIAALFIARGFFFFFVRGNGFDHATDTTEGVVSSLLLLAGAILLLVMFTIWRYRKWRRQSNRTPHADARDVPAHASDSGARAGGRER